MKNIFIFIIAASAVLFAAPSDNNESNSSSQKKSKTDEQVKKQMEKEQKFAREQTFYQGEEYDTKSHEVDPNSLSKIPTIKPDYDFDMSEGVYSD